MVPSGVSGAVTELQKPLRERRHLFDHAFLALSRRESFATIPTNHKIRDRWLSNLGEVGCELSNRRRRQRRSTFIC